ncbi:MAG: 4Fe-4S dicluster domain-containing protein [Desulfobacterales bacterium]|uniref:4Fe-4S dicluster domain-containing protein n=1 Tax=Candidatus Desulfaltia bathyphila TaxID=2841697 RepID=A0A8J6N6B8_9BACT|nr:4Fe-4S dicluster domain-containing protein [Candidatus Desulfaltia bathyphila]MBL7207348.1 4Fe-4S dicluster domain-containing protein [Desulfobacterales bacterium]
MAFNVLLYTSLFVFISGVIYKIYTWFSWEIGISSRDIDRSERLSAAFKGMLEVIFSAKILILIKVFILDVVFQKRILKEDFLRWAMHMLIYTGFMLLLLMHALDEHITASLFSEYYSTLNPFFFLRNFFSMMVIAGLTIAIYRRFILKVPRLKTNSMDYYAIIILTVIMISGFFLEATKITSISDFERMVEEFSDVDEKKDINALESLWVHAFGVVSPDLKEPFEEKLLEYGREIHEINCASCHSSPKWAFTGYALANILNPIALRLDRAKGSKILWYIHILACFFGLAYLPFSKMFHIIAGPISLLANAVMEKDKPDPANIATRQVMELDACTHCGTCSLGCSAATAFDALDNENILPSEKMVSLKSLIAGKKMSPEELKAIQEGVCLCTNCDRCTVVCPVGINLKELWLNVREDLIQKGYPEPLLLSPFSFVRGLNRYDIPADEYYKPVNAAKQAVAGKFDSLIKQSPLILQGAGIEEFNQLAKDNTFSYCFSCQNCTSVCPVVCSFDKPEETLGLLPHQIMRCLGLGLIEMASGASMIWDCLTCYQCQEHCPQNVNVTDLFFGLKNLAIKNVKKA